jgi:uncharacterized membrane protein YhaH (DUF805 family)
MIALLFSAQGRLSRAGFWKAVLLITAATLGVAALLFLLAKILPGGTSADGSFHAEGAAAIPYIVLVFGSLVFSIWAGLCIGIKRYHDRGKSGAWVLIQFVPLIGPIWYLVEAGFLTGTPGANRYGPDMRGTGGPVASLA